MYRIVVRLIAAVVALSGLVVLGGSLPSRADPDGGDGRVAKPAAIGDVNAILSGTVSTADDGYLEGYVDLYHWDSVGEFFDWVGSVELDSATGSDTYSFDVPTGSYYVYADSYDSTYLSPVYSGGATEVPVDLGSPGVIELTESGATADLEFQLAPDPFAVTGTITDNDGNPLSDIFVWADSDTSYDESSTDVDGSFTLALRPGAYVLNVDGGEDYEGASVDIEVTGNDLVLDPIALAAAGHWSLSGKVVDSGNEPIEGADVALVRLYGDGGDEDWYDSEEIDWAQTGADGTYTFDGVRANRNYTVLASADGYGSRYAGGVRYFDSPGLESVNLTEDAVLGDFALPVPITATGRVTNESGTPLDSAAVVGYQWFDDIEGGFWDQFDTGTTNENGAFAVELPEPGTTVTFRFARGGYTAEFLGGGSSLPDNPDGTNSRTVPETGGIALGDVALAPFVSKLGKVAGQDDLDYCLTTTLPANDDDSSEEVDLPFELKFYGNPYSSLYVNNNGNVTFGEGQSEYTPEDLTGETARPIIAPFFADVDTSGEGSNVVTYGASPDGKTFCVNWADVGYFGSHTDKLNTFQLLLTTNENSPGRGEGDFDIRFNYDELLWETGDASGGENGFGGTSAAAGFSAGTGEPGSFVQLPGSLVNGALIDGGPEALVAGSQNASQTGRYNYEIRNSGFTSSLGTLEGSVVTGDDQPVEDASVEACTATWVCYYGDTNGAGEYAFTAINAGQYTVSVDPPSSDLFPSGASATVTAGETTTVPPIVLQAPVPIPDGVTLTNNGVTDGVPSVYYGDPLDFRVPGCAGVTAPSYTVTLSTGQVIRDGVSMTEGPVGVYTATIAPFAPHSGDAMISTNIPATCGGDPVAFNVYIDPAGVVSDQWGRPIDGATVTLLDSATFDGDYAPVPDGSDIMSEDNRTNPDTTGADGSFQWLVQPGYYKVKAEAEGCDPRTTGAMAIPPERTQLAMKLECDVPAPTFTVAPSVTGTPQVGQTITANAGTWPEPLVVNVELLRDGVPLPEASYKLTPTDVGKVFTARTTARTPNAQSDEGPGGEDLIVIVQFESVTATSAAVTGTASSACGPAQAALVTAKAAASNADAALAKAAKKFKTAKAKMKAAKKSGNAAKIAKAKKKVKKAKNKKKAAATAKAQADTAVSQATATVTKSC